MFTELDMNTEPKKKNEKPSSNFREEVPKDKVPAGNKTVTKSEDKVYTKQDANFDNPAKKREESEQPIHPIKKAPKA